MWPLLYFSLSILLTVVCNAYAAHHTSFTCLNTFGISGSSNLRFSPHGPGPILAGQACLKLEECSFNCFLTNGTCTTDSRYPAPSGHVYLKSIHIYKDEVDAGITLQSECCKTQTVRAIECQQFAANENGIIEATFSTAGLEFVRTISLDSIEVCKREPVKELEKACEISQKSLKPKKSRLQFDAVEELQVAVVDIEHEVPFETLKEFDVEPGTLIKGHTLSSSRVQHTPAAMAKVGSKFNQLPEPYRFYDNETKKNDDKAAAGYGGTDGGLLGLLGLNGLTGLCALGHSDKDKSSSAEKYTPDTKPPPTATAPTSPTSAAPTSAPSVTTPSKSTAAPSTATPSTSLPTSNPTSKPTLVSTAMSTSVPSTPEPTSAPSTADPSTATPVPTIILTSAPSTASTPAPASQPTSETPSSTPATSATSPSTLPTSHPTSTSPTLPPPTLSISTYATPTPPTTLSPTSPSSATAPTTPVVVPTTPTVSVTTPSSVTAPTTPVVVPTTPTVSATTTVVTTPSTTTVASSTVTSTTLATSTVSTSTSVVSTTTPPPNCIKAGGPCGTSNAVCCSIPGTGQKLTCLDDGKSIPRCNCYNYNQHCVKNTDCCSGICDQSAQLCSGGSLGHPCTSTKECLKPLVCSTVLWVCQY